MKHLAARLDRIAEPQTIKMAKLSRALKSKGIDVIDLSLGEPDFNTPENIVEAATLAMSQGYTKYTPVAGYPELRQAIVQKLAAENQLHYDVDQIVVSTGAKQALANAVLSLIDPGDEVIIPTPYWVTYSALVDFAEGQCVFVQCPIAQNFKLTPQQLEAAITSATRLFMFSSPCNPSGSVYSKEELAQLVEVFKKHPNVYIISDEIYEYINYVGAHQSIAQFSEIKDRVILVNGFSKGFAMTGWRLGYMAAPKHVAEAAEKIQAQFTSGANSITQRAAIAALTEDKTATQNMVVQFQKRKDFVVNALNKIPGVKVNNPDEAFYAFPDLSSFIGKKFEGKTMNSDEDLSMYLLEKGHVTTVAGSAFGAANHVRLSVATSMEKLEEGTKRIQAALARLD